MNSKKEKIKSIKLEEDSKKLERKIKMTSTDSLEKRAE